MRGKSHTDRRNELTEKALIYLRVSTQHQVENHRSLKDQRQSSKAIAETHDLPIKRIIDDKAESGTDFDRDGIREVRHRAEDGDVSYVIVDQLDRIGRSAVETLYYITELREECGVTIITSEKGEIDISETNDLIYVMLQSVASQATIETQARRAEAGVAQEFQEKNWFSAFGKVPFGYQETDDGWIAVDPDENETVLRTVDVLLKADPSRAYTETLNVVPDLPDDWDHTNIRDFLSRPLLAGRPTTSYVDYTRNSEDKEKTIVHDESLRILDDETFEKVQHKIDQIYDRYSSDKDEPDDVESLVDEFGPDNIVNCHEIIQQRCPECDTELVKNGRRGLNTRVVHIYRCPNYDDCGKQWKFPTQKVIDELTDSKPDGEGVNNSEVNRYLPLETDETYRTHSLY